MNLINIIFFTVPISKDLSGVDELHENAEALIEKSEIDKKKLIRIGINMPSLVDFEKGNNHAYFQAELGFHKLFQVLKKKFNKPVYLQNDVKSAALAKYRFGLARRRKNVLVISLDWRIGLGILMNGKQGRPICLKWFSQNWDKFEKRNCNSYPAIQPRTHYPWRKNCRSQRIYHYFYTAVHQQVLYGTINRENRNCLFKSCI